MRLGRLIWLVAGVGSLLTGCFYIDPINRRPKISDVVRQCDTSDPAQPCDLHFQDVHRGDSLKLKAIFTDPDSQLADSVLHWVVSACGSDGTMCDSLPLYKHEGADAVVPIVVRNILQDTGGPVQLVAVELDVFDDRGASDSSFPQIPVIDGPTLTVSQSARSYTVGAPIDMFATYGDPDEGPPGTTPSKVQVVWTPITPDGQQPPSLSDLEVPQNPADPAHVTVGERLVPPDVGDWDVRVRATDAHEKTNEKHLQFTVAPDQPPCLAQWAPIAAADGATVPITEPTLFEVPLVDDDLDPYPPVPDQPLLGTTRFAWSILPPGAPARQPLIGATGNSVDFDPAAFTPGQIVELRVEIFDRSHGAVACADGDPVCFASPGCNQRQTWRVEIR